MAHRARRTIALALATGATVFFDLMLVGSAFGPDEFTGESIAVGFAALVLTGATVMAWLRYRHAALALILTAVVFALVIVSTAGSNVLLVTVLLPAPWLVAGLLLLGVDRRPAG
jgi:hypothetical protein